MTRRFLSLLVAFLAIPGLLGRQVSVFEHEHEGGADPHAHHALLAGYVDHSHPHEDAAHESEAPVGDEPVDDDGTPDDDRHGHYQTGQTVVLRRTTLVDDGRTLLAGMAPDWVSASFESPVPETFSRPPSPGDSRGHPMSRTGRTIDRLVQGIGLLI